MTQQFDARSATSHRRPAPVFARRALQSVVALGLGFAGCAINSAEVARTGPSPLDRTQRSLLNQQVGQLQLEVEQAEAIRAVKRLQRAYGHYLERGLWRDLGELFTDNAVGHYPAGTFIGKASLREHFFHNNGRGKLGVEEGRFMPHIVYQPVITLSPDGKTANGRWRVLAMLGNLGGSASWAGGIYENQYVRDNGVWKINTLHYYSEYGGPYDGGWGRVREAPAGGASQPRSIFRNLPHPADMPHDEPCSGYQMKCVIPFHYASASRAGTPILPLSSPATVPAEPLDLEALQLRFADLQRRVESMNDESQVEALQRSYGYYLDRKMWDDVADLFAANGTLELDQRGVYVGTKSIRRALDQFGPQGLRDGQLNDHIQMQMVVTVAPDGRTANARGIELSMTGVNGQYAELGEGIFENSFVKENGVWKFQSVHFFPTMITDYEKGWGKDAKPAPGPSKQFPPDRPPSVVYEIYPKYFVAPFHFDNPVSGRPTQYPEGKGPAAAVAGMAAKSSVPQPQTGKPTSVADLQAAIVTTRTRLNVAKGYDAAENLVSAYGYYVDQFMWDDVAELFAEQGTYELPKQGVYMGRDRILKNLQLRFGTNGRREGSLATHFQIQPVIHVAADGSSAKVRVRLLQMVARAGGDSRWGAGVYEDELIQEHGIWKLKSLEVYPTWSAPYVGGWARVPVTDEKLVATPSEKFPPDRPPTRLLPFYPKVADLPFHYKNPVSGRAPPVLLH